MAGGNRASFVHFWPINSHLESSSLFLLLHSLAILLAHISHFYFTPTQLHKNPRPYHFVQSPKTRPSATSIPYFGLPCGWAQLSAVCTVDSRAGNYQPNFGIIRPSGSGPRPSAPLSWSSSPFPLTRDRGVTMALQNRAFDRRYGSSEIRGVSSPPPPRRLRRQWRRRLLSPTTIMMIWSRNPISSNICVVSKAVAWGGDRLEQGRHGDGGVVQGQGVEGRVTEESAAIPIPTSNRV